MSDVGLLELIAAGVMLGLALSAFAIWMHERLKPIPDVCHEDW
jgi:hypothetical protein